MLNKRLKSLAIRAASMTAVLIFYALPGVAQEVSAPRPTVEEAYLARDDGNGRPGEQIDEFATGDIPIHCVILLDGAAKVTVKMNFVTVAVSGIKAETKVVTASYTTKENQNRVNFTGRPDGKWMPGRYRLDIFVDGKQEKQLEFSIKGTPIDAPAAGKFTRPPSKPKSKTPGN